MNGTILKERSKQLSETVKSDKESVENETVDLQMAHKLPRFGQTQFKDNIIS